MSIIGPQKGRAVAPDTGFAQSVRRAAKRPDLGSERGGSNPGLRIQESIVGKEDAGRNRKPKKRLTPQYDNFPHCASPAT
jgi:hypothetical protein